MEWNNLRLEAGTFELLEIYRRRLDYMVQTRPSQYPDWMRVHRVSLGLAIRFLLHGHCQHQERNRRMQRKRRVETLLPESGEGVTTGNGRPEQPSPRPETVPDVASAAD